MSELVQILPTHLQHSESLAEALELLGFSDVRVTDSRRCSPAVIVIIQCQKCRRNQDVNIGLHINNPLAPIVFVHFSHETVGCDIRPRGVVHHLTVSSGTASRLIKKLGVPPKSIREDSLH